MMCCFFLAARAAFAFLELVFPVVHDLDHGWPRRRRYLNQVLPAFLGQRQRFVDGKTPNCSPSPPMTRTGLIRICLFTLTLFSRSLVDSVSLLMVKNEKHPGVCGVSSMASGRAGAQG